jgi:hypothetical protein
MTLEQISLIPLAFMEDGKVVTITKVDEDGTVHFETTRVDRTIPTLDDTVWGRAAAAFISAPPKGHA